MNADIVFSPYLPAPVLIALLAAGLLLVILGLWRGARGTWLRAIVFAALTLVLANPSIREEEREPIKDVVAVVVDESQSQDVGEREQIREQALAQLKERLSTDDSLEIREIRAGRGAASERREGTALFEALDRGLADVPPERLAGAILLTDGQVHDAPESAEGLGFEAPVHMLLTGRDNEKDRKLTVEQAPAFGIVGQPISLSLRVDDFGTQVSEDDLAKLTFRVDGEERGVQSVRVGRSYRLQVEVRHAGPNVVEVEAEPGPGELTLENNRAVIVVNGIRDRLRVLLVSGEPHPGQRTWRNLLKSDPSIDLVHFTILRPPEKQDFTPQGELSLIEFPVNELFNVKLYDFDLVIFDRYKRRPGRVLPMAYFANITRYVEDGGALLVGVGEPFASRFSLYQTTLAAVFPARPTGRILTDGFQPEISELGARHPVTAQLPMSGLEDAGPDAAGRKAPEWGRWFRLIDSDALSGQTIMTGERNRPLLVLDRVGEGRVAQFMSDQAWLWSRGFEGGGPQQELLRRLAHWLMKEPDLEEEVLRARTVGGELEVTRRTMEESAKPVEVTFPDGTTKTVELENTAPGEWTGSLGVEDLGLYRLSDGTLSAVAAVGPVNPLEFEDLRTSAEKIGGVIEQSGGGTFWLAREGGAPRLPSIRRVSQGRDAVGGGWMGLVDNNRYAVRATRETALIPWWAGLLLLLGGLLLAWRAESR